MKFSEPLWLLAGLAACGTLVWAWRRYDARQRAALANFASSHLLAQLTASFSAAKRNWKRGLFLAAVGCLFVALARPQAGFRWEEVKRRGIEVIFAVDTSRSMLTPDVKPDRLTRAKLAVDDFVSHLNGDGVGSDRLRGQRLSAMPHHHRLRRVPRVARGARHHHHSPRRHGYCQRHSRGAGRAAKPPEHATKSSSCSPTARTWKATSSPRRKRRQRMG